jgi:hypothetical protein
MPRHRRKPLTGSEQLLRRITIEDVLTGAALALWLVPVALLFTEMPSEPAVLVVGAAGAAALAAFLIGVVLRSQRRNAQWREHADWVAFRRHTELVQQVAADHQALIRIVMHNQTVTLTNLAQVNRRVDDVNGKLDRASWDIYADGLTDQQGGPEVVNGEITRRLQLNGAVNNVVQFTRPGRGKS